MIATLNNVPVERLTITIGGRGPWYAEVDLVDAATVSGRVTLKVGTSSWVGTVTQSGTYVERTRCIIVGGGAGWGKLLPRRGYHNDANIKARAVADDAAREAGETIDTFIPGVERLGAGYARIEGYASNALEDAIRGATWWVDRAGVTHVGTRPASVANVQVLDYNPRTCELTMALDDLGSVDVGATVTAELLPAPLVVKSLELTVTPDAMRARAWCAADAVVSPVADALAAIARKATAGKLHGLYRYRVVSMVGQRVNLQACRARSGIPDLLAIDQWHGIPGVHAELAAGGEVGVMFLDGDATGPVITSYIGGAKSPPTRLEIGGVNGPAAARQGDAVEVLLPPAVFSGTIGGAPATGVLTFPAMKALGTITGGSGTTKIAT